MTKDLISPTGETIRIERSNNMKKITTENRTSLREESIRKERSNNRRSHITQRRNNEKKNSVTRWSSISAKRIDKH